MDWNDSASAKTGSKSRRRRTALTNTLEASGVNVESEESKYIGMPDGSDQKLASFFVNKFDIFDERLRRLELELEQERKNKELQGNSKLSVGEPMKSQAQCPENPHNCMNGSLEECQTIEPEMDASASRPATRISWAKEAPISVLEKAQPHKRTQETGDQLPEDLANKEIDCNVSKDASVISTSDTDDDEIQILKIILAQNSNFSANKLSEDERISSVSNTVIPTPSVSNTSTARKRKGSSQDTENLSATAPINIPEASAVPGQIFAGASSDDMFRDHDTETDTEITEEDEWGDYRTRCICGMMHDDNNMIDCDICHVWQHMRCMGVLIKTPPSTYLCELCHPRTLKNTEKQAINLQIKWLLKNGPVDSLDITANLSRSASEVVKSKGIVDFRLPLNFKQSIQHTKAVMNNATDRNVREASNLPNVDHSQWQVARIHNAKTFDEPSSSKNEHDPDIDANAANGDDSTGTDNFEPPPLLEDTPQPNVFYLSDKTTLSKLSSLASDCQLRFHRLGDEIFFHDQNSTLVISQVDTNLLVTGTKMGLPFKPNFLWQALDWDQFRMATIGRLTEFFFKSPRARREELAQNGRASDLPSAGRAHVEFSLPPEEVRSFCYDFTLQNLYTNEVIEEIAHDLLMEYHVINHGFALSSTEEQVELRCTDHQDQGIHLKLYVKGILKHETTWLRLEFSQFAYAIRGQLMQTVCGRRSNDKSPRKKRSKVDSENTK